MASITVSQEDVQNADLFLSTYAKDKVPDADFSEGSVTRDFVIKAIAYIFAYLRKEQQSTRDRQSLLTLSELEDDPSVDEAVDALLSNWFITRKIGRVATLPVILHFSKASDVLLTPTTKFYRTASLIYYPNITANTVYPTSDLRATVNSDGSIEDYTLTLSMKSADVGTTYNVAPGRFVSADNFNPYFAYAENTVDGYDGVDVETTNELLVRAPTAITVRNLVNARSIDTVLRDTYAGLKRVVSIGFGDPEMIRDYADELVTRFKMHTGGFNDIYLEMNRSDAYEKDLLIGGSYARPDGLINILRDSVVDFLALGVEVYDVLRVTVGLPRVPMEFVITNVAQHEVTIRERYPFQVATDEADPATPVSYTIGKLPSTYSDTMSSTTGYTSRTIAYPNKVMLAGRPHYRIKQVTVVYPSSTVDLTSRVNQNPQAGEYCVWGLEPAKAQSAYAVDLIEVNPSYAGYTINVTYETLSGYDEVQTFVTDRFERVLCANPLAKALHPVYVSLAFSFRSANNASGTTDLTALSQSVSDFINNFDATNYLDMSVILKHIRDNFPNIGTIYDPVSLTYYLAAPDGQVYEYQTKDVVTIFPSAESNRAFLTNGLLLRDPINNADIDPTLPGNMEIAAVADAALLGQLSAMGISDRTTRYMTQPDLISPTQL